jgi:hypothetical protein
MSQSYDCKLKVYEATSSPEHFENKNMFITIKKALNFVNEKPDFEKLRPVFNFRR